MLGEILDLMNTPAGWRLVNDHTLRAPGFAELMTSGTGRQIEHRKDLSTLSLTDLLQHFSLLIVDSATQNAIHFRISNMETCSIPIGYVLPA